MAIKPHRNPAIYPLFKKAVFFTSIAIMLSGLLLFFFVIQAEYRERNKMFVIETRVDTINEFIHNVREDLKRGAYIAGFRSLLGMEQFIITSGKFLNDTQAVFLDAFLNGTINQTEVDILEGASFTDWAERIREEALTIDILINVSVEQAALFHRSPWTLIVALNTTLEIADKKGTASWKIKDYLESEVPIEGLEDPLYGLNSFGRIANVVKKTPFTAFVTLGNTTNLRIHVNNSYYRASSSAPSFLMRFSSNLSSSQHGIESLVNLEKFSMQQLPTKVKSVVDYIYFSNRLTSDQDCGDMPSWFLLDTDDAHYSIYECSQYAPPPP